MTEQQPFVERCETYLEKRWHHITELSIGADPDDFLRDEHAKVKQYVRDCLTSRSKSYHYVLPTQVLCKVVDPSLNAHSLQVSWGVPGAFDARTVAHKVVVPFDQANHNVLGGSPEPYVNNPLRFPAVSLEYRDKQKYRADWDKLTAVLDSVEDGDQEYRERLFDQILLEIYRLLVHTTLPSPTPSGISLAHTREILAQYLSSRSGGERAEAICTALFRTVGQEFCIFDEVKREKVTAADTSSGMAADIECWSGGKVVLLVEVKDRSLTLTQIDAKIDAARAMRISEILFIAEKGKAQSDSEAIDERIRREFVVGQNLYISNLSEFALGIMVLLGEKGRVELLDNVGAELDRTNAAYAHRKGWADLLRGI